MKALVSFLTSGLLRGFIALTLLSLAIWYGGPYLAFGTYKPMESVTGRLIAILALLVFWSLCVQLKSYRAQRAGSKLAKQVANAHASTSTADTEGAEDAEAAQLRARFAEAIASLRGKDGRAVNLYKLPWYIIIGPPGAGKTTIIASSGLNMPLAKKFGRNAVRGVAGTRNCDWWFTREAILLDTAGRYTTQESARSSDHAGWVELLKLLRSHRTRRPINGVIVAFSVTDLLGQSDTEREQQVAEIRRRLDEISHELRITVPVYCIVTKLDLIAGFTEFFDDLTAEGRAQVWGITFPLDASRAGTAATLLPVELDHLLERLNARLMLRMEVERDVRLRSLIFTFPNQLAALRRNLTEVVGAIFTQGSFEGRIQLRGVYFTSGTQEGTPLDRMMGALTRAFALNMKDAGTQSGHGRAYFIQRLLRDVLLRESGLAGVNRSVQLRHALIRANVYLVVIELTAAGLLAFSVSYGRNLTYVEEVGLAMQPLQALHSAADQQSLPAALNRLDVLNQVLAVTQKHQGNVPISMRWGLYQGRSMANAAHDAYLRELNAGLLPFVAEHFRSRLASYAGEPDKLYEYLKAYLMLGMPQHLDAAQLRFLSDVEWRRAYAQDPAMGERVAVHFNALLLVPQRMQPAPLDEQTVEQARTSLRQASVPLLMYSRLKLAYASGPEQPLDIEKEVGLGGDALFVRKSGASLSHPFPAMFTRPEFEKISTIGTLEMLRQLVDESWVLGGDLTDVSHSPQLAKELLELYERDYIAAWDALLGDLALRPTSSTQEAVDRWGLLGASTSPLKRLLVLVDTHTNLLKPPAPGSAAEKAKKALTGKLGALNKMFAGQVAQGEKPGTRITRHFEPLHQLVAGSPAPIDATLAKLTNIQRAMAEINALGGPPPLELATRLSLALKELDAHAKTLPGPLEAVVAHAAGEGTSAVTASVSSDFSARYSQQVITECRELASGRYPLSRGSAIDLPLADFTRLFGPSGTFDTFFRETMQAFVDVNQPVWQWKPEAASIGGSPAAPAQFQRAERIRSSYFSPDGTNPEVRFTLMPVSLDPSVERMIVEIDGQTLEFGHGPQRTVSMVWPGPAPGHAAITLEEPSGARPYLVTHGPWALFRLLERANIRPESGASLLLTFDIEGRTARLALQANSSRNPFLSNKLRGFGCTP